jgi:hypothetical protein
MRTAIILPHPAADSAATPRARVSLHESSAAPTSEGERMQSELPAPLVPAEVDLRGLPYMPLYGSILFGSDFDAKATDAEWRTALTLWWQSWNQVPAASLPNDDAHLAKLAGFGRDVRAFLRVKSGALHKFVECSDGRLYHEFLAPKAVEAWAQRLAETERRDHEAERQARHREERKRLFEQLKEVGIVPPWDMKTADLRALVKANATDDGTTNGHAPVTRTATASKGREGKGLGTTVPLTGDVFGDADEQGTPEPSVPDCPHDRIVEAYHAALPTCTRVREWGDRRRAALRSLWRDRIAQGKFADVEGGLAYFARYFAKVARSSFLTGRAPTAQGRPFVADLEWLVKPANFVKVIEGKYDDAA